MHRSQCAGSFDKKLPRRERAGGQGRQQSRCLFRGRVGFKGGSFIRRTCIDANGDGEASANVASAISKGANALGGCVPERALKEGTARERARKNWTNSLEERASDNKEKVVSFNSSFFHFSRESSTSAPLRHPRKLHAHDAPRLGLSALRGRRRLHAPGARRGETEFSSAGREEKGEVQSVSKISTLTSSSLTLLPSSTTPTLLQATAALERQEVPIGCVLVDEGGRVVARGSNRTNEKRDVSWLALFFSCSFPGLSFLLPRPLHSF